MQPFTNMRIRFRTQRPLRERVLSKEKAMMVVKEEIHQSILKMKETRAPFEMVKGYLKELNKLLNLGGGRR